MTFESAKNYILEQVSLAKDAYESFEIQFMGGEPLLEFVLIQQISYWIWAEKPYDKNYIMFVQTNGTLLNDSMKSWFITNKSRFFLALSMDGTMDMQNINRSNSFSSVDTDFFIQNWPTQNVKMTISPQTISNLSNGVKYLHELGFKHIAADMAMGTSVKWKSKDLIVYKNELDYLVSFYEVHHEFEPFSMLRIDPTVILYEDSIVKKTCSCGEDLVCVDWDGKTYACHLFSPISISLEKSRRSNDTIDFSNHSDFLSEKCKYCKLNSVCNHCYGMNYICSDDIRKPSAFHCNAFKIRFYASCKLFIKYAESENNVELYKRIKKVINSLKVS